MSLAGSLSPAQFGSSTVDHDGVAKALVRTFARPPFERGSTKLCSPLRLLWSSIGHGFLPLRGAPHLFANCHSRHSSRRGDPLPNPLVDLGGDPRDGAKAQLDRFRKICGSVDGTPAQAGALDNGVQSDQPYLFPVVESSDRTREAKPEGFRKR